MAQCAQHGAVRWIRDKGHGQLTEAAGYATEYNDQEPSTSAQALARLADPQAPPRRTVTFELPTPEPPSRAKNTAQTKLSFL